MTWLKGIVVVLLLLAIGFLAWSWTVGPLRIKRDIRNFAENMGSCTAFSQDFIDPLSGQMMNRTVTGAEGESCGITMQTYSPQSLHCEFAREAMPELARAFGMRAGNIGFFGGMKIHISTENPDVLQRAMNSPACKLIGG